jgi:hypothetical protein
MKMDIDYLPIDLMHMTQRQVQNALTQDFVFKSNCPVGRILRWTAGVFGGCHG